MLNPYPMYHNPIPGPSNHLQFESDRDSASPSSSESSSRSDDPNKSSRWSLIEENGGLSWINTKVYVITTIVREGNGKRFKHYEDIDEFMSSSDKVNKRFVKETKAHKQDCSSDDTNDIKFLSIRNRDRGLKLEKRPATSAEGDTADAEKTGKTGQKDEKGPKKKKKA